MDELSNTQTSRNRSESHSKPQGKMITSGILGAQSLLVCFILLAAWTVAFFSRLFAVVRFESIIHEFDPW